MDVRTTTKEMAERRYAALETLKAVSEWLIATKPSNYLDTLPQGAVDQATLNSLWREWVGTTTTFITKLTVIPDLLLEDIKRLYEKEGKD